MLYITTYHNDQSKQSISKEIEKGETKFYINSKSTTFEITRSLIIVGNASTLILSKFPILILSGRQTLNCRLKFAFSVGKFFRYELAKHSDFSTISAAKCKQTPVNVQVNIKIPLVPIINTIFNCSEKPMTAYRLVIIIIHAAAIAMAIICLLSESAMLCNNWWP